MKKSKNNSHFLYAFLVFIIAIFCSEKTFQNDLFWTIAQGRKTLTDGIIQMDQLTYHEGLKFYNVRWLFDILCTVIYNNLGNYGIYGMVIIMTIITSLATYIITYKITKKPFVSFLTTSFGILSAHMFFTNRAQLFSICFFVLEIGGIQGLLRTNKIKYYVLLLTLPILLINIHATLFPLYFILMLPFIAEYLIGKTKFADKIKFLEFNNFKYYKELFILIPINILEGFISPLGIAPFVTMVETMSGISNKIISEMQPLSLRYVPAFCVYLALLLTSSKKIKAYNFFMIIGLALMSMKVVRSLFFYYMIGGISMAETLSYQFENFTFNETITRNLKTLKKMFCIFGSSMLLIWGIVIFAYNLIADFVPPSFFPTKATEYLKNDIDLSKYKLYNGFVEGGYLEFHGIKTFIDSRAEIFEKPYNNTDILKDNSELLELSDDRDDYLEFFKKYNLTLALITKNSRLYTNDSEEKFTYLNSIYEDDYFIIYEINIE